MLADKVIGCDAPHLMHSAKHDTACCMQEASLDAYEAMPISSFGEAMMRGMGWKEGLSVGRNAPKEVSHVHVLCQHDSGTCSLTLSAVGSDFKTQDLQGVT